MKYVFLLFALTSCTWMGGDDSYNYHWVASGNKKPEQLDKDFTQCTARYGFRLEADQCMEGHGYHKQPD